MTLPTMTRESALYELARLTLDDLAPGLDNYARALAGQYPTRYAIVTGGPIAPTIATPKGMVKL